MAEENDTPVGRRDWARLGPLAAAVVTAVGGAGMALGSVELSVPFGGTLVVAFLLVAPALAIVRLLPSVNAAAALIVACAGAAVINSLVAVVMLLADAWSRPAGVIAVGLIAALLWLLPTSGRTPPRHRMGSDHRLRLHRQGRVPSTIPRRTLSMSVVICAYTFDRWDDILAAVASVRNQSAAAQEIVVVVDHNPDLYVRLGAALPDVTVVENRHQRGLSGGKDTGVEVTSSDVVAFLDDDAVAHPDWLRHFRDAYTDENIVGVGGTTLPLWASDRPRWFPEEFDWVLGCTFTGREPGAVRNLLGGNASFRREVFSVAGGFPSHIGRTSAQCRPLGCEETEFCIRVRQCRPDWTYIFEPRAVIWHRVGAERERFAYFRSRCFAEGLSKAAVTRSVGIADGLSVERTYTARTLTRGVARGLGDALHGDRAGIERSCAISVGLIAAAAGYARGGGVSLRRRPAMTEAE